MNHIRAGVRRLAVYCPNAEGVHSLPGSTYSRAYHIAPRRPNDFNLTKVFQRQTVRALLPISNTRYCSYQRTMCKGHAEAVASGMVTKSREVLPTNVKPLHYDLTLEPDFTKFIYEGRVITE